MQAKKPDLFQIEYMLHLFNLPTIWIMTLDNTNGPEACFQSVAKKGSKYESLIFHYVTLH